KYAKELGFEIEKIKMNGPDYKKAIASAELMTDLGSTLQNYNLFEKVKQNGFKVVLTGDAADEVFRGYKRNLKDDYIYSDIFNELVFYHFPRLDKLAMAHTVEYRSPYSADYIIDFGLSIPYEQGINKEYLRKIYKGFIPDYILNRKKVPLKRKDEEL
ncbi:MAG: asparagine synthase-related protein, partial [Nanoarchaeota archaeon]